MRKYDYIYEAAIVQSKEMAEYLLENYAGMSITKSDLKIKFQIPHNRAVLIWSLLKTYNILVGWNFIFVPKKEDQKKLENVSVHL